MASICKGPNGRKIVQFVDPDFKRKTLRLGKFSTKSAETVRARVEGIISAKLSNSSVDDDTARWLRDIPDGLAAKLAAVGLMAPRTTTTMTLKGFLDAYIAGRTDYKPNTARNAQQDSKTLTEHFGPTKLLRDITPGDVDAFVVALRGEGMANATLGRLLKRCKQFFRAAERMKLIRENPFADVKPPAQTNEARKFYVSRDMTEKLLAACPDAQWRLLVALSRFGGLRCPSESLALTWGDVDWERERIRVRSPKTEHLVGGESRTIPLFPELRPYLEEAFEQAEPGTLHVVTICRDASKNFRTRFARIIGRAGLEAWPKPFHNLRASRETELAETYPVHVVCQWIGNTERIAAKHYLQVTEVHFEQAVQRAAKSDVTALQKAKQSAAASKSQQTQTTKKAPVSQGFSPMLTSQVNVCQFVHIPPRGVEPLF